jgi:threonine dehydrogenase-like Zn-dependent dehydrogenase
MIEDGKLDTKNLISHVRDMKRFEDFKDALDTMTERRENACKIILKP